MDSRTPSLHPHEYLDSALVALTLAGILRLRQAFFEEASAATKQVLLRAAAQLLDRTVCSPALRAHLADLARRHGPGADPLPLLLAHRQDVAVAPASLWPPGRTRPNDLGPGHYRAWRALERLHRHEFSEAPKGLSTLNDWLTPVWAEHPGLQAESANLLRGIP